MAKGRKEKINLQRVRILKTLKAGGTVYDKGTILVAPDIPGEIVEEFRVETGTVEALPLIVEEPPPLPDGLSKESSEEATLPDGKEDETPASDHGDKEDSTEEELEL